LQELCTPKHTGYFAGLHENSVIVSDVIERLLFEAPHLYAEERPGCQFSLRKLLEFMVIMSSRLALN